MAENTDAAYTLDRRVQTQDNIPGPQIRPVASPIDTYVRPTAKTFAEAGGGDLMDLADAFKSLEAPAKEYQATVEKQNVEAGAAARVKNMKSFKQAVDEGLIHEAANPWFAKGYAQQDGRLNGMEYDTALRTAYMTSPAASSDDPGVVSQWMAQFRQDWIAQHDPGKRDWLVGFAPEQAKADNSLVTEHIHLRQQAISQGMRDDFSNIVGKLADNALAIQQNPNPDNETDVNQLRTDLAGAVQRQAAALVSQGLSGKDANKIIAEVLITKGEKNNDPDFARSVLTQIKTPGGAVAGIADVDKALTQSEHKILSLQDQMRHRDWEIQDRPHALAAKAQAETEWDRSSQRWAFESLDRDKKKAGESLFTLMMVRYMKDGVIDRNQMADLAELQPHLPTALLAFKASYMNSSEAIQTDKAAVARFVAKMNNDPKSINPQDIWAGVTNKTWDLDEAWRLYHAHREALKPENDPVFKDKTYNELHAALIKSIGQDLQNIGGTAPALAGLASDDFSRYAREVFNDQSLSPSAKSDALRKKYLQLLNEYDQIAASHMKSTSGNVQNEKTAAGIKQKEGGNIRGEAGNNPAAPAGKASQSTPTGLPMQFGSGSVNRIPQPAIDRLRSNLGNREEFANFDAAYGAGAATFFLSNSAVRPKR